MHITIVALTSFAQTALGASFAVYDGPPLTDQPDSDYLLIGVDDAFRAEGFDTAASGESNWIVFGTNRPRDEKFTVSGVMVAWDGAETIANVRARAVANLTTFSNALRADPSLGGITAVAATGLSVSAVQQMQSTVGQVVQIPFSISCRSRI
jgi:hypothetical protein